jgi:tyrosine-protein kinase Etk/Wzc
MVRQSDTIDLGEIVGALRRGWAWIVGGVVVGGVVALAIAFVIPPSFEGRASVLLRSGSGNTPSVLSRLSGLADMVPFGGGMAGLGSGVETEIKVLTSRTLIGRVVDELGLQAEVSEPAGRAPLSLFSTLEFSRDVAEGEYEFTRTEEGFRVDGPKGRTEIVSGVKTRVGGALLSVRPSGSLPERFVVDFVSREEAITEVAKNLSTDDAGDVAELTFRAGDPQVAAAVPNRLVSEYLLRRKSTDRGVNQHRFEFLTAKADSLSAQLQIAETALRSAQEQTGVIDPELSARAGGERMMEVRSQLETVDVDARALEKILAESGSEEALAKRMAAYPTLLKNPAINDVLGRLLEQQTARTVLLEKRTERDPEVMALTETVNHLQNQLTTLSREYLAGLHRQQTELRRQLSEYEGRMGTLPREAEENLRLQREVKRLSETLMAVQTQAVQARLAAMGEGGDVRTIDVAVAPEKPVFPKPLIFLIIGVFGGTLCGLVGALSREYLGESIGDPHHVELATGLPALLFEPDVPLYLGGQNGVRSILVLPVGRGALPGMVARQLVRTAGLQGRNVRLLDLTAGGIREAGLPAGMLASASEAEDGNLPALPLFERNPTSVSEVAALRDATVEMESRFPFLVIATGGLSEPSTTALLTEDRVVLLVARIGSAKRSEVRDAVETLTRLGMTTSGVVLHNGQPDGSSGN